MSTENEFELPDEPIEVSVEPEGALDIVVEDDTPPEDRGRKPLGKDALAVQDEAEEYSEGVKRRIGELRHQAHDERREKERAQRERDEAVRVARTAMQKAKELEQRLTYGEASFAEEVTKKTKLSVKQATEKYQKAYEAGDSEAMAEAVGELTAAKQEELEAMRWHASAKQKVESSLQQQNNEVDFPQSHQPEQEYQPQPDPRATEWIQRNPWYNQDRAMTALAFGVHEYLVESGVHPERDADKYYSTIDAEMRRRFPEYDWQDEDTRGSKTAKKPSGKPKTTSSAVAPVSRVPGSAGKGKVVLTQTQVRLAKDLGLTLEEYAREVVKLEQNGA